MSRPRLRTLEAFAGCGGLSYGLEAVESIVFTQDFNSFLSDVLKGKMTNASGQPLPLRGEVQLLCGGPPCQGFSGLNRFRNSEKSLLKNSLVSSYLSCCDYYRPQLFLMENAGNYGLPQNRLRVIIMAAAPGQILPRFPESKASFKSVEQASTINSQEVRGSQEGIVRDHELLSLSPITQARLDRIPFSPGANWRDLPNERVRLSDGTYTSILPFKTYKGIQGQARGAAQGYLDKAYARLDWDGCAGTVTTLPKPDKAADGSRVCSCSGLPRQLSSLWDRRTTSACRLETLCHLLLLQRSGRR
ncbi:hypothetical protein MRX96_017115 [Rhipicephalus microplus]